MYFNLKCLPSVASYWHFGYMVDAFPTYQYVVKCCYSDISFMPKIQFTGIIRYNVSLRWRLFIILEIFLDFFRYSYFTKQFKHQYPPYNKLLNFSPTGFLLRVLAEFQLGLNLVYGSQLRF